MPVFTRCMINNGCTNRASVYCDECNKPVCKQHYTLVNNCVTICDDCVENR